MEENLKIPAHVALILDGNGRWAKKRGLPRQLGHKKGCETLEQVVEDAARLGIRYLTVYGFSTENWKRPEEEVGALMQLFRFYAKRLLAMAEKNNIRVRMIGERGRFASDIDHRYGTCVHREIPVIQLLEKTGNVLNIPHNLP